jgi:four helix bundle protein
MILGRQLLRAGTSVGANYRAACRARSPKEFFAKLGVVVEECDESSYWMEMLVEAGIQSQRSLGALLAESEELLRIFSASHATTRRNLKRR